MFGHNYIKPLNNLLYFVNKYRASIFFLFSPQQSPWTRLHRTPPSRRLAASLNCVANQFRGLPTANLFLQKSVIRFLFLNFNSCDFL
ncbi:hypothetical protein Pfo_009412 [Paulownia fortunei]|nr:hypothetical protein Pfo_009412 [Paulownia fortunei]